MGNNCNCKHNHNSNSDEPCCRCDNNYYQYCWVCIKSNIELFVWGKRDLWSIVENPEIELAGNIFDNPELLESEE